jgi:hypothetical protein
MAATLTTNGVEFSDGTSQTTAGTWSQSLAGYRKLPDGTLLQWGYGTYVTNTVFKAETFPIAFPNQCRVVNIVLEYSNPAYATILNPSSLPSTTGFEHFTFSNPSGIPFRWFAIGY